jgi:hypothetical protein
MMWENGKTNHRGKIALSMNNLETTISGEAERENARMSEPEKQKQYSVSRRVIIS